MKKHERGVYDRGTHWQARVRRKNGAGVLVNRSASFPYDPAAPATGRRGRSTALLEAEKWAARERAALRVDGRAAPDLDEAATLEGWAERYEIDPDAVLMGGHRRQCSMLRRLAEHAPALWKARADSITPEDIAALERALLAPAEADGSLGGLQPGTAARYLTALDSLWKAARGWGFTIPNPGAGRERAEVADGRKRVITAPEWRAITAALAEASPAVRACVRWLRATACRRGESCALQWTDLDWSTDPPTATLRAETTKNGRARSIPVLADAVAALRLARGGKSWPTAGRVFQCEPDSVGQAWRRAVARAGVPDARLHDLRHTRITEIAEVMPIADAMKLSGHRTTRMLMRYYNEKPDALGRRLRDALRTTGKR